MGAVCGILCVYRRIWAVNREIRDVISVKASSPKGRFLLFCLAALLWEEIVFRATVVPSFFSAGLFLMLLFTVPITLLMYLLCTAFETRVNRTVTLVILGLVAGLFSFQIVCAGIFNGYLFELNSVSKLGKAFQFLGDAAVSVWQHLLALILVWVPFVLYLLFGKRLAPAKRATWKGRCFALLGMLAVQLVAVLFTLCFRFGGNSPAKQYTQSADINASAAHFGLLTAERLDLKGILFRL